MAFLTRPASLTLPSSHPWHPVLLLGAGAKQDSWGTHGSGCPRYCTPPWASQQEGLKGGHRTLPPQEKPHGPVLSSPTEEGARGLGGADQLSTPILATNGVLLLPSPWPAQAS